MYLTRSLDEDRYLLVGNLLNGVVLMNWSIVPYWKSGVRVHKRLRPPDHQNHIECFFVSAVHLG